MRITGVIVLGTMGCLLLAGRDARAVITYPQDDATLGSVPHPPSDVVGAWGGKGTGNATAIAIAPNYILTARHPGGGVGTTVTFGSTNYVVAQETLVGTADLRIDRITTAGGQPANLTSFTPLYTGNDTSNVTFTLGGYGLGRGADLTTTGGTYGYQWAAGTNSTLRFGRNRVEGADTDTGGGFNTNVLTADFDPRNDPTAVPFEAIAADFDSGSGWFVENGTGNWQVAALTLGVGHTGANANIQSTDPDFRAALFASRLNAAIPAPDAMDGVRLSSYASFINANIPEPGSAALAVAGGLLMLARRGRGQTPAQPTVRAAADKPAR